MASLTNLIVALDYSTLEEAINIINLLGDEVKYYKVGMQLYYSVGDPVLTYLHKKNKKIFLDLKINDIPATIYCTVTSLIQKNVHILSLFTSKQGLLSASQAVQDHNSLNKPLLCNVTVLTSEEKNNTVDASIYARAKMSMDSGADGVICSGQEVEFLRNKIGKDIIIITPGVRYATSNNHDQKRPVTPQQATSYDVNYIVVGRLITQVKEPLKMARQILKDIS